MGTTYLIYPRNLISGPNKCSSLYDERMEIRARALPGMSLLLSLLLSATGAPTPREEGGSSVEMSLEGRGVSTLLRGVECEDRSSGIEGAVDVEESFGGGGGGAGLGIRRRLPRMD